MIHWIYAINIGWINAFFRQAQEGYVYPSSARLWRVLILKMTPYNLHEIYLWNIKAKSIQIITKMGHAS